MKILIDSHFNPELLGNSYVISSGAGEGTILVDPYQLDLTLFELLESRGRELRAILFTHLDEARAPVVRALRRIYHFDLYGGDDYLDGMSVHNVKRLPSIDCMGIRIAAHYLPGLHMDSMAYHVGNFLFTGDILSAGLVNEADSGYGKGLLIQCLHETFQELAPSTIILPAKGPPSTVRTEEASNHTFRYWKDIPENAREDSGRNLF